MTLGVIIQVIAYPGHVPLAQFIVGRVMLLLASAMA